MADSGRTALRFRHSGGGVLRRAASTGQIQPRLKLSHRGRTRRTLREGEGAPLAVERSPSRVWTGPSRLRSRRRGTRCRTPRRTWRWCPAAIGRLSGSDLFSGRTSIC